MNPIVNRRMRRSHPMVPARASPVDIKPFALQILESGNIQPQDGCPLFTAIPKEIRDLIFEYTLASYPDPNRPYSNKERFARPGVSGHPRIAIELLLTCKATYVETYQLPITLNPVIVYHDYSTHVPPHARRGMRNLRRLALWQLAALHMVDISLQQVHLEDHVIAQAANALNAGTRYDQSEAVVQAQKALTATKASEATDPDTGDGDVLSLSTAAPSEPQTSRLSGLEMPSADYNIPRVIDKLTLRLGRTEWWTWEDPPYSAEHLAIDPGHGDGWVGQRCTPAHMLSESERRRRGEWTGWGNASCWGAQVAQFKGLKTLECVFETFKLKESQLDTIVECAKTWIFPMADGYALTWDGEVEKDSWTGVDDYGYEEKNSWLTERTIRPTDNSEGVGEAMNAQASDWPDHRLFVVRTIRFTRTRYDD